MIRGCPVLRLAPQTSSERVARNVPGTGAWDYVLQQYDHPVVEELGCQDQALAVSR
jgi:hypothetical protein